MPRIVNVWLTLLALPGTVPGTRSEPTVCFQFITARRTFLPSFLSFFLSSSFLFRLETPFYAFFMRLFFFFLEVETEREGE